VADPAPAVAPVPVAAPAPVVAPAAVSTGVTVGDLTEYINTVASSQVSSIASRGGVNMGCVSNRAPNNDVKALLISFIPSIVEQIKTDIGLPLDQFAAQYESKADMNQAVNQIVNENGSVSMGAIYAPGYDNTFAYCS
jgi:hypothetical protein